MCDSNEIKDCKVKVDEGFVGRKIPADNRNIGEWKSRYLCKVARKQINWEKWYLIFNLLAIYIIGISWAFQAKLVVDHAFFSDPSVQSYVFAWIGGTLGGIIFALKWLYHTVARGYWNQDRKLWRIFTPHISGGLSLAVIIITSSFKDNLLLSNPYSFGVGFLVGYFSDNAVGKLSEIANVFFSTK